MATELLMSISKDQEERARFMSRRKFETDLASNILTAETRGREEVIKLIEQGFSLDEIKTILTKKRTTGDEKA